MHHIHKTQKIVCVINQVITVLNWSTAHKQGLMRDFPRAKKSAQKQLHLMSVLKWKQRPL